MSYNRMNDEFSSKFNNKCYKDRKKVHYTRLILITGTR